MGKIEHVGTVIEIDGQEAIVELKGNACNPSSFACSCCPSFRPEPVKLRVERSGLEQGDTVRVFVPAYTGYLSTLVVFVLPLVLTIVGLLLGSGLEPSEGAHGTSTVVGGIAGFLLAVAVALLVNRWLTGTGHYDVQQVKGAGS